MFHCSPVSTTGYFRFCSNLIFPREWTRFSKHCPVLWCWVCRAGFFYCQSCLRGMTHHVTNCLLGSLCHVGGTQLSASPELSRVNSSSRESYCLAQFSYGVVHVLSVPRSPGCALYPAVWTLWSLWAIPCPYMMLQVQLGYKSVIWLVVPSYFSQICFIIRLYQVRPTF